MKNYSFFVVFFSLFLQSIEAQCERVAPFQDGPDYHLNGSATLSFLLDGTKTLSFDNSFDTADGPDLHVYLSQSAIISTPSGVLQTPNTIEIGKLKSHFGAQTYDLTQIASVENLDSYAYVIIHCKDFDHYWGTGTFGNQSGSDCANLSVTLTEDESVQLYPTIIRNNQLFIQLERKQKVSLKFYSVVGEIVNESLILSEELNKIDTSFLQKGMYIVQLNFDNKTLAQKIIIQ